MANRGNEITDKLKKLKATRDNTKVIESLRKLQAKAEEGDEKYQRRLEKELEEFTDRGFR